MFIQRKCLVSFVCRQYLLNCAVHREGLVHIRGLILTAMTPYDHVSCHIQLLLIFNLIRSSSLPQLPALLPITSQSYLKHAVFSLRSVRFCLKEKLSAKRLLLCSTVETKSKTNYLLALVQSDLLKGSHESSRPVRGPELRGRLQLPQLEIHSIRVISAVLTTERDKRLQFACGYHCGSLFIDVRHEFPISALFL